EAAFLSLRRGERWRREAATEWGNHLATAATGIGKRIACTHRPDPRQGRPPLRRAALDTSPPIDGGEEGCQAIRAGATSQWQTLASEDSAISP
ncbi:hypothetical protein EN738_35165, partial [Mesorhizobium sp. M4B.F.Ca.ET.017.02.2.1]